ncbi:MAG TPA: hypothetical protein VJ140_03205 [Actinomycetota bacterium]|nr:hypothetical protein [Actinomycetota bacterium]
MVSLGLAVRAAEADVPPDRATFKASCPASPRDWPMRSPGGGWDAHHRGAASRAGAGGRTLSNPLVWSRQARTRVTDLGPLLSWLPTAGPGG